MRRCHALIGGDEIGLNDMTHLRTHCKFMMLMPRWNFLNFFANQIRPRAAKVKITTAQAELMKARGEPERLIQAPHAAQATIAGAVLDRKPPNATNTESNNTVNPEFMVPNDSLGDLSF